MKEEYSGFFLVFFFSFFQNIKENYIFNILDLLVQPNQLPKCQIFLPGNLCECVRPAIHQHRQQCVQKHCCTDRILFWTRARAIFD